ncbi:MAG: hypothetical protein ACRC62_29225 [Microcoleus sp.]
MVFLFLVQSPAPSKAAACLSAIVGRKLVGEDRHCNVRSGRAIFAIFELRTSSGIHPLPLAATYLLSVCY